MTNVIRNYSIENSELLEWKFSKIRDAKALLQLVKAYNFIKTSPFLSSCSAVSRAAGWQSRLW